MKIITCEQLRRALIYVSERIIDSEQLLTEIDSMIGDGDHGTGMKTGFSSVLNMLDESEFTSVSQLFNAVGLELLKTMGGASGVIFGTLFIGGHKIVDGKLELNVYDLLNFFESSYAAIIRRGKTQVGYKTMIDALSPAIDELRKSANTSEDIVIALEMAAKASRAGAEATKFMLPRIGRAKNYRDQAVGYPDPGAVSTAIIFDSLYKSISTNC